MQKKVLRSRLTLTRETLHRLTEQELGGVAGAGPTNGAPCDRSQATDCATCACPPPP